MRWNPFSRSGLSSPSPVLNAVRQEPALVLPKPAGDDMRKLRRQGQAMQRSLYAAGQVDRTSASWGATPLTADEVIDRNQRVLVARSRERCAEDDHAKAFMRICRQNIVGAQGIQLKSEFLDPDGQPNQEVNEAIEWAFFDWSRKENADVTGQQSWRSLQRACVNSAVRDGEYMIRLVWGRKGGDAGPWGFSLQFLDPQRCPVDMNERNPEQGAFIRQGIEFNKFGRPTAYFFTTLDEGERAYVYGGRAHERVPAEQIIHGFERLMPGQKRGLPWMATSLFRMRHLGGFEDAAVMNARMGASKMGFIEYDKDADEGPDWDEDEDFEITADPGAFVELPRGAKVAPWAQQYPAGEFMPVTKHLLRGMAAGMGASYAALSGDLEGVNFSSIRQGELDSREHWKEMQEWLIESLCDDTLKQWLPRALLGQRIQVGGKPLDPLQIDVYRRTLSWQARRWAWIDPRADVDAAESSKNNFLTAPSDLIREQGRDPLAVWKQTALDLASQRKALESQGFTAEDATKLIMNSMGIKPEPPKAPPKNDAAAKTATA